MGKVAKVASTGVLIERRAPLDPTNRRYLGEAAAFWRALAEQFPIAAGDRATWRALTDPAAPTYLLTEPDFYHCDGQYVVTGRVPGPATTAG